MKTGTRLLAVGLCLGLLGVPDVQAGRMFGGKTLPPPPAWCFCSRVCAGIGASVSGAHIPQGQSLANCPRLHDEVIYDNMASCSCTGGTRAQTPQGMSPNR